jgi:carnitine 3-dehydrogenase
MEHADIRHVAVIGTGTIGASWAAYFMSRGLSVAASEPAPQAEATLRRFVAASWPALVRLGARQPLPDKVHEDRLSFHADPEAALAGVDFVQENAPERVEVKRALLARLDAALPPEVIHRLEFVRPADEPLAGRLPSS